MFNKVINGDWAQPAMRKRTMRKWLRAHARHHRVVRVHGVAGGPAPRATLLEKRRLLWTAHAHHFTTARGGMCEVRIFTCSRYGSSPAAGPDLHLQ